MHIQWIYYAELVLSFVSFRKERWINGTSTTILVHVEEKGEAYLLNGRKMFIVIYGKKALF